MENTSIFKMDLKKCFQSLTTVKASLEILLELTDRLTVARDNFEHVRDAAAVVLIALRV
jgi:hypothetical protein